jgi:HK97 family phage portal protein
MRAREVLEYLWDGETRASGQTVAEFGKFDLIVPQWARYNEELFVAQAYRTNPVVYACIEYIARNVASATMYAMREGDNGEEKLSHGHNLQRLMRRPAEMYPTQTRFIRQMVRRLLVSGECPLYTARYRSTERVARFQMLPGKAIQVKPKRDGIAHYEYRPNGEIEPTIIKPRNMVFLKLDDPDDPLRGCSPLAVAWRETQTDNSTTDYRKAFFDNAAIPGGVLTTNMPAQPEQLKQWAQDFTDKFSGPKKAGKTPALAGGLEYQKAGATPGEVDFANVTGLSETRMCMAFGMHPIIIAAMVGLLRSTYSNFKEAKGEVWESTIVPLQGLIADDLTAGLTSEGDRNYFSFDVSKVPALQGDAKAIAEQAKGDLLNGAITVNEYRIKRGFNPVPNGDVYYRPNNVTMVPADELDEKPELPVEGEPAASGDAGGETDPGGRPANPDEPRPPTPGAANDERDLSEDIAALREWASEHDLDTVEDPAYTHRDAERLPLDGKLLNILQELHAGQNAVLMDWKFDRFGYASQVAARTRSRLAYLLRRNTPAGEVETPGAQDFLDAVTIELGNEMTDFAQQARNVNELADIAAKYTARAMRDYLHFSGEDGETNLDVDMSIATEEV